MEKYLLKKDVNVFCLKAKSFPAGILDAHGKLRKLAPASKDRKYFGISRPENGKIVYRAAAEEIHPGEAEELNCEAFIIKSGEYISIVLKDYGKDPESIGRAFEKLIAYPGISPDGYCIEQYPGENEVRCMVILKP